MKRRELTKNEQSALNIVGALIVVLINVCINFFLSPFIVEHLGVEANGYITLANNFVSYFALITVALDSMAGRFMLIELRKGNLKEANKYYTSVLFGDWIIGGILLIPVLILIVRLDSFIDVPPHMMGDVRLLFALVFLNFYIGLCVPHWRNATYSTNRLYLRSLKSSITAVLRAAIILMVYYFLPPFAFYVAVAGLMMTIANTIFEYIFKINLLPDVRVRVGYFEFKKVKELIFSGIWNAISQCGNLLLEGLDLLIANIFIDATASGVLSVAKIIPNMINQIVGNIATTFGPRLAELYADGDMKHISKEVKSHIKIVSTLANIPMGVTFALGVRFFTLWVPSQSAITLTTLSSLTLLGMLFYGVSNCIVNIFTAVNKLKTNSLIVIASGLMNIIVVYILLCTTDLGIYAITGVSSFVSIIRVFAFTAPYAAHCIGERWHVFYGDLIKGAANVLIPIMIGMVLDHLIRANSWMILIGLVGITCAVTVVIDYFWVLNKNEQIAILKVLHVKKK